jgi:hypothetical protein
LSPACFFAIGPSKQFLLGDAGISASSDEDNLKIDILPY